VRCSKTRLLAWGVRHAPAERGAQQVAGKILIASDLKVYGTATFGVYIAEACIIKAEMRNNEPPMSHRDAEMRVPSQSPRVTSSG
jgi:hypothetical protein